MLFSLEFSKEHINNDLGYAQERVNCLRFTKKNLKNHDLGYIWKKVNCSLLSFLNNMKTMIWEISRKE